MDKKDRKKILIKKSKIICVNLYLSVVKKVFIFIKE